MQAEKGEAQQLSEAPHGEDPPLDVTHLHRPHRLHEVEHGERDEDQGHDENRYPESAEVVHGSGGKSGSAANARGTGRHPHNKVCGVPPPPPRGHSPFPCSLPMFPRFHRPGGPISDTERSNMPLDAWILLAAAVGCGLALEVVFRLARRRDRGGGRP